MQAEQPNRQTYRHAGKLCKTDASLCMQVEANGTTQSKNLKPYENSDGGRARAYQFRIKPKTLKQ
jgi:hypothetical protein